MANRRISDLQEIAGVDIAEQDLFTLVKVAEVDPELKNKKVTISGTKQYLNIYYLPRTGGTINGNTTINGTLNVVGLTDVSGLTVSNQASVSSLVVQNTATVNGTLSGTTITGNGINATNITAVTVTATTFTGTTISLITGNFSTRLSGATITGNNIAGTSGVFNVLSGVTITGTTVQATTGVFNTLSAPSLTVSGNLTVVSGFVVSGAAQFASTVSITGQLNAITGIFTEISGAFITGDSSIFGNLYSTTITGSSCFITNITGVNYLGNNMTVTGITGGLGRFTTVSGISGTFAVITGTTVTGTIAQFTTVTGISGAFTVITGITVTGTTANFTNGVFSTQLSGVTVTGTTANFTSGVFTQVNGGQLAGTRNRLINGAMSVDQRNSGAVQTITGNANLAYCVDRWAAYCTPAINCTGQQFSTILPRLLFTYQFTGAASITSINFLQRIEQINSSDLVNNTVTLSAELANTLLTSVTWSLYYANTTNAFGTVAAPTKTLITSGTFTVTSTVTRYSANISVPSAATTGLELVLSVGAQTSGTWIIGNVQLELGSIATPFERRSYGLELSLCERYYQRLKYSIIGYGGSASANLGGVAEYNVTMRAVPTLAQVTNNVDFTQSNITPTTSTYSGADIKGVSVLRAVTAAGSAQFSESFAATAEL